MTVSQRTISARKAGRWPKSWHSELVRESAFAFIGQDYGHDRFFDSSPHRHHGTLTSIQTDAEGWNYQGFVTASIRRENYIPALRLDASRTGYVSVSDAPHLDFEDEGFTVMAWLGPEATSQMYAIGKLNSFDFDDSNYHLGVNASTAWEFGVSASDGGSSSTRISGGTVTSGKWTHVVGTHKAGGAMELFVDGASVATGTASSATASNAGTLAIGQLLAGNSTWNWEGRIAEVLIIPRALSDGEIWKASRRTWQPIRAPRQRAAFSPISAALTGTATDTIDESDIVAGGKTVILTLAGDTWVNA